MRVFSVLITMLLVLAVSSCDHANSEVTSNERLPESFDLRPEPLVIPDVTPTKRVQTWPMLWDDLNYANLPLVLSRQIARLESKPLTGNIQFGDIIYPKSALLSSLYVFSDMVNSAIACQKLNSVALCQEQLNKKLQERFYLFKPNTEEKAFFTGYYTPLYQGSLTKTAEFSHAIYREPSADLKNSFSRTEIDFDNKLAGKGYELFFIKDLFDSYILHVEGGGKIVLPTGESFYLSYNSTNKMSFRFISKYMEKAGYITNLSNDSQHDYLLANPSKEREIYDYCPSYVYFKITDHPPLGSDTVPLTDGRSIATDSKLYSNKGVLTFVSTVRSERGAAEARDIPLNRFFIDQDTGGAIKGMARADLYLGEGDEAGFEAANMDDSGDLYFLMLKALPHKKQ